MPETQTNFLIEIEDIYMLSSALSGLIMVFHLAIEEETNSSTSHAFRIVSDKSYELAKKCEELFKRYQDHILPKENND